jgi:hypothetical protein
MNASTLSADTTVAQALEANPAVGPFLTASGTACVGCYLARFCTLRETSNYYNLPLDALVDELRLTASDIIVSKGGPNV